jgi:hypothetical protein
MVFFIAAISGRVELWLGAFLFALSAFTLNNLNFPVIIGSDRLRKLVSDEAIGSRETGKVNQSSPLSFHRLWLERKPVEESVADQQDEILRKIHGKK